MAQVKSEKKEFIDTYIQLEDKDEAIEFVDAGGRKWILVTDDRLHKAHDEYFEDVYVDGYEDGYNDAVTDFFNDNWPPVEEAEQGQEKQA